MRAICILTFAVSVASAQSADPPKKIRIEGTVLSATHEPVKKPALRLVVIDGPTGQAPIAFTENGDDSGKFVIEDVPPGTYSLTATKAGFVAGAYGARSPGSPGATIGLTEGTTLKNLEITLVPQGIIAGRVTTRDGDPVAQAMVTLYRTTYVRGRKQMAMAGRGSPNSLGNFSIANVAPGHYYVAVQPTGVPAAIEPGMGDLTTYYPNGLDVASAVALDVAAGAHLEGIDVRLRRERVYSVKGKLMMDGSLVKDSILQVSPFGGGSVQRGTARLAAVREGLFEVRNLIPGTYTLRTLPGGGAFDGRPNMLGLSGQLDVTVTDADLEGAVLAAGPGVELNGAFKLEGGVWRSLFGIPGTGAPTTALAPIPSPSIGLQDTVQGSFANPIRLNEDGTFKLLPVAPGAYLLDITGLPQGTYIKSVRYGNQEVTRSPLNLLVGGPALEVVLAKNAASIAGTLHSDKSEPIPGVQVTVWPKNPNSGTPTGGIKTIYSDQNGSFRVGGLEPGEYYAAAWDEIESGLAQTPEFLVRFTSQSASIKLDEGVQGNVDVKVIPKDAIAREAAKLP